MQKYTITMVARDLIASIREKVRMNLPCFVWSGVGLLAIATIAWTPGELVAHAGSKCVRFAGLEHCPVGEAVLELFSAEGPLEVHNPGGKDHSGVSVKTPDTRSWVGQSFVEFDGAPNATLQAASISEGAVTSRALVKHVGDSFAFSAAFTGSLEDRTYSIDVLSDGVWQGGLENVPSGTESNYTNTGSLPEYDMSFYVMDSSACRWGFRFDGGDRRITLPDGQTLMGNELLLTEEVKPAGAYPYTTFDRLVFRGTFVRLDFISESFE